MKKKRANEGNYQMKVIAVNFNRFKNIYNKAIMKICNKETQ